MRCSDLWPWSRPPFPPVLVYLNEWGGVKDEKWQILSAVVSHFSATTTSYLTPKMFEGDTRWRESGDIDRVNHQVYMIFLPHFTWHWQSSFELFICAFSFYYSLSLMFGCCFVLYSSPWGDFVDVLLCVSAFTEMLSWFFIWNEQWGMYFLADGGERDRERRRRRVFIFTSSPEVQRGERERVRERWWKVRDDGFARNSAHLIAKNCCTDVPPPMQWRWRFASFMIVAKACSPFSLNRLGFYAVWK